MLSGQEVSSRSFLSLVAIDTEDEKFNGDSLQASRAYVSDTMSGIFAQCNLVEKPDGSSW